MNDASFHDGAERPLKLLAHDSEDAQIVSMLVQDGIAERKEMLFEPDLHCFSLLIRRFRWEDVENAQLQKREFERVQSVLSISSVKKVSISGFDPLDKDLVFDLIGLIVNDDEIRIVFAGEGEIKLEIEAIDLSLSDVSRPYIAHAQNLPNHGVE